MAKEKRFNYVKRKLAVGTWHAIICALAGLGILVLCLLIAVRDKGEGPMVLGALGVTSMMLSGFSVYYCYVASKFKNANRIPANVAGIVAAVTCLAWIFALFVGLRIMA